MVARGGNLAEIGPANADGSAIADGGSFGGFVPRGIAAHPVSQVVLVILLLCYGLQVFSPLRLDTDSIAYLSIAESAAEGSGFLQNGQKTVLPPGYPALLAVLLKTGLGHSWAIIGLNLILLAAGLFAAYRVLVEEFFKDKALALNLCSLTLLSFVVIKPFTIPLSDVAFFCCAMCCVAVMSAAARAAWGQRFLGLVAASWVLTLGSIALRRIGVALVPAFVFMVVSRSEFKTFLRELSARAKTIIAAVVVAVFTATVWVVVTTSTLSGYTTLVNKSTFFRVVWQIVSYRLTELGELMVNAPLSKVPATARGIAALIIVAMGLVLFVLTVGGLLAIAQRRRISATDVLVVSYVAVLFAWPYYDTRFWLPLIPLLFGYLELSIRRAIELGLPRAVVGAYVSVFVILGFAAIGYSTRITFAGPRFPDRYGDGTLRPTYCLVFQSCSDAVDRSKVNPEALHLLRTYR